MFVDASAIVAILTTEPDAAELTKVLATADGLIWSPIVRWEAATVIARQPGLDAARARTAIISFGGEWSFTLVPIGEREDAIAFEAYRTYGKRSGHPASLNMGDCFAYACAKSNGARLLYKGDDFAMTDLA